MNKLLLIVIIAMLGFTNCARKVYICGFGGGAFIQPVFQPPATEDLGKPKYTGITFKSTFVDTIPVAKLARRK